MDAMELLVGRESAVKLSSPGPDQEALEKMFQSALRAPDHGRLRPWRFVVVPEDKRERFGELMADCLRRMDPAPRPKCVATRTRQGDARAGDRGGRGDRPSRTQDPRGGATCLRRGSRREHHAGGNAQGFGAMWKTGAPAYDAWREAGSRPRSRQ